MSYHRTPFAVHCVATVAAAAMTWALCVAPAAHAQSSAAASADRLHAEAVASFKQGRYPEAYGRFISLANAGHAPSATIALFMHRQGPALFGREWDLSPDQMAAWTRLSGGAAPVMQAQAATRAKTSALR